MTTTKERSLHLSFKAYSMIFELLDQQVCQFGVAAAIAEANGHLTVAK